MNTTIMAERQAKALQTIIAQVARLGGRLETPTGRAPNPQVKHTLLLEAVAAALVGIGAGQADVTEANVTVPPAPAGPVEVEPVEAIISVVVEQDAPAKMAAPKAKRGKE